jgi:hypothetical protein
MGEVLMSEQTNERYCVLVNGHAVEPGCWVEGHWGQYGPDHLADQAETLGWHRESNRDDPRWWRMIADALNEGIVPNGCPPGTDVGRAWDQHVVSADAIEQWLNDHTETEGYSWGWYDGEFYLWVAEAWEEE